MGGNIFNVDRVSKDELYDILWQIYEKLFEMGFNNFEPVGSVIAHSRSSYSDIDIAVPHDKRDIMWKCMLSFGPENVRAVGAIICIKFACKTKNVQIDLIPCDNAHNASWLMRGRSRHMIFALLASKLSNVDKKITIASPGGVRIFDIKNDVEVLERSSNPKDVISALSFKDEVQPSDLLTMKDVIRRLQLEGRLHLIKDYEEYIKECLMTASQDDIHDFNAVIEFINSAQ